MVATLAAIVAGILLAVGGSLIATNTLASISNGTPSHASLYQYGNR